MTTNHFSRRDAMCPLVAASELLLCVQTHAEQILEVVWLVNTANYDVCVLEVHKSRKTHYIRQKSMYQVGLEPHVAHCYRCIRAFNPPLAVSLSHTHTHTHTHTANSEKNFVAGKHRE